MEIEDPPATALWRRLEPVVSVQGVSVAELLPGGALRVVARHGDAVLARDDALAQAAGLPCGPAPCRAGGNAVRLCARPAPSGGRTLAHVLCWDGRRWLVVLARVPASPPFSRQQMALLDGLLPGLVQQLLQECERADVRRLLARLLDDEARFAALTVRERQVCLEIMTGASTERAARRLGIGVNTVLTYRKRIYAKLGISSLAQLLLAVLAGMRKRCVT
nr:helix-turn-helix transcriptional regulator [Massilia sp. JS1662]